MLPVGASAEPQMTPKPKIAIACQGGGSHTAFTAGALRAILTSPHFSAFELVGLSGASGGAICAALAWSGLISGGARPCDEAARRLGDFWRAIEAAEPADAWLNFCAVAWARAPLTMMLSPYLYAPVAERRLRDLIERFLPLPPRAIRLGKPKLFVGATDIGRGEGVALPGEDLTYDDIVASAALPPLFRAVHTRGGLWWDGLFSRNPPVREFTDCDRDDRPDHIWVIRINPKERREEPCTLWETIDRGNEISGNLALEQELKAIEKTNALRVDFPDAARRYKHMDVSTIELDLLGLDYASKLDRRPWQIRELMAHGDEKARVFLEAISPA
jgi:NTE family protein